MSWAIVATVLLFASILPQVKAASPTVNHWEALGLDLGIQEGGDSTASLDADLGLGLSVGSIYEDILLTEELDLALVISFEGAVMQIETLGLSLGLGRGLPFNLVWVWDPYDQPKLTGKNYTYMCYIGLEGTPQEDLDIVIRFEGSIVTEKTSNATGQFEFWAVVGSPGLHTWSFTLFDGGEEVGIIWKDTDYVVPGPDPEDEDEPDGPGPDLPDLPTEPGSLFVVLDYFPVMVVFGIFAFSGMLLIGQIGILFGAVAALFVTTAMGTLPTWVLFFAILITILVVIYKLRSGGSKVSIEGGNGA